MPDSSPASTSSSTLAASVSLAKIPGTLHLSSHMLKWSPSSSSLSDQSVSIPLSEVDRLLESKANPEAKTCSLKLTFFKSEDAEQQFLVKGKPDILFVFTAPEGRERALGDREAFKEKIGPVVKANRAERENAAATEPLKSRAASVARQGSEGKATPVSAGSPAPMAPVKKELSEEQKAERRKQELELRISILKANPELKALHADLVITGVMRDAEFWSHPTRAALLRAERAVMQQKQGRNAMIADPRPSNDGDGNLRINLSAQMVRDMFEQYPVVAKAYDELVPKQLDEQNFWARYFQSKLYHRLRTSARSAASEHIVRADEIFDKYLDDVVDDDDFESRQEYHAHDSFLDLAATEVDHQETGNRKDYTMRAGAERSALPLLRRFNQHSTSLLDSALGPQTEQKRLIGGVGEEYDLNGSGAKGAGLSSSAATQRTHEHYDQIVIEELQEERRSKAVPLELDRDKQGFFEGKDSASGNARGPAALDPQRAKEIIIAAKGGMIDWKDSAGEMFENYKPSEKHFGRARKMITDRVKQQEEARKDDPNANDLSPGIQQQIISCHSASMEFLRQFWAAVAPPPPPPPTPAGMIKPEEEEEQQKPLTPAQRKARAKRMLGRLRNTHERVSNIAKLAEEERPGHGAERVKDALEFTQAAIDRAIKMGDTLYPNAAESAAVAPVPSKQ